MFVWSGLSWDDWTFTDRQLASVCNERLSPATVRELISRNQAIIVLYWGWMVTDRSVLFRLHPWSRLYVHQWDGDQHLRVLHPAQQMRHSGRLRPSQEGGQEQESHGRRDLSLVSPMSCWHPSHRVTCHVIMSQVSKLKLNLKLLAIKSWWKLIGLRRFSSTVITTIMTTLLLDNYVS